MGENSIVSIMHISDLHKSPQDSYESLFQSLVDDCNVYSTNNIKKPDIVVVSGDIIRGGSPDEIVVQYSEVKDFLEKIVIHFLEGKKERIVIVPGNHDIDWNISKASMQKIENTKENFEMYRKGIPNIIRWAWEDFSFYKINDTELYNKRMESFVIFYNNFYNGIQTYSIDPKEQFQIFDLPNYGITFFNIIILGDY
jgi:predicted MPP superfamily phosphohydrolase